MARIIEGTHRWQGLVVVDPAGEKVGKVHDVYLDRNSQRPEWALVRTGLLGTSSHFVPLAGAVVADDEVLRVPHAKAAIAGSPTPAGAGELRPDEEAALYQHYGIAATAAPAPVAEVPSGAQVAGVADHPSDDDAMTRSEEEVSYETVRRPAEVVRLRKYLVTEEVTMTVSVQREEVRLERVPLGDDERIPLADPDAVWGQGTAEMVLHEEQVVVTKRVVPRERVRLETRTVTEDRVIATEVRKEHVDVEREPVR